MKWYKVLIHVLFYMSSTKNYHFSRAAPPPLSCYVKGFPLTAKSFWNTATYQKLWRGVPSTPPSPLPLCSTQGVWICVYVRRSMYLILTIFLYLLVNRFAVRIMQFAVYLWYCIQAVFTDPGTYNWGPVYKYPFLFENGVFSPLVPPIVYM